MATLNIDQITQLAYNAGFRGNDLSRAVAIALAESGIGNGQLASSTTAYNPETAAHTPIGSGSRGLWQVWGKGHPEYNNDTLYDPKVNAAAAFSLYKAAGGFSPWTTASSVNGAPPRYLAYLPAAQSAAQKLGGSVTTPPSSGGGVSSPLDPILKNILGSAGTPSADLIANVQQGGLDPLAFLTSVQGWLKVKGEQVSFFIIGLLIIVIGGFLVIYDPLKKGVGEALKAGMIAA